MKAAISVRVSMLAIFAIIAVWADPAGAAGRPLSASERAISGAWRLVGTEEVLKSGGTRISSRYGPQASGSVIYHSTRRFCLFLTRDQGDPANAGRPGEGLNAYCGTWSIDPAARTMYHHTEMDILPSRRNLIRTPKYELSGGRMRLFPPIEDPAVASYALIFDRVR